MKISMVLGRFAATHGYPKQASNSQKRLDHNTYVGKEAGMQAQKPIETHVAEWRSEISVKHMRHGRSGSGSIGNANGW